MIAVLQAVRSKAADLLMKGLSVTTLEAATSSAPIGVVADAANATQALAHVLAKPETVNALALIAPSAIELGAIDEMLAGKLSSLTTPVLALFGMRDADAQAGAAAYRKALPGCNVMFVYDASGDMANERPEAVASAVSAFVRQRERYVASDRSGRLFP